MQKQLDWLDEIQPLSLDKDEMRKERILKQVTEQLPDTAESEKNIMKHTKLNKHIRPLIVIAAALGIGAVSVVAANAATDGAILKRMTAYIDGVPYEVEGRLIQEDENMVEYEFEVTDNENDGENHEHVMTFEGDDFEGEITVDEDDGENHEFEMTFEGDDRKESVKVSDE